MYIYDIQKVYMLIYMLIHVHKNFVKAIGPWEFFYAISAFALSVYEICKNISSEFAMFMFTFYKS